MCWRYLVVPETSSLKKLGKAIQIIFDIDAPSKRQHSFEYNDCIYNANIPNPVPYEFSESSESEEDSFFTSQNPEAQNPKDSQFKPPSDDLFSKFNTFTKVTGKSLSTRLFQLNLGTGSNLVYKCPDPAMYGWRYVVSVSDVETLIPNMRYPIVVDGKYKSPPVKTENFSEYLKCIETIENAQKVDQELRGALDRLHGQKISTKKSQKKALAGLPKWDMKEFDIHEYNGQFRGIDNAEQYLAIKYPNL
jgi:hypothetical protein